MPLGEEYANRLVVAIDGAPIPPDSESLLVSAYIDDSVHVPSMAVLRFSDPADLVLTSIKAGVGKQMTVAVQQSGQGAPVALIDADITALEREIDERGAFTTVRGLDVRHRLQSGAGVTAFVKMTVSDIVRKIAQENGLAVRVGPFTTMHDHRARSGESDLDFLGRLARGVGAVVRVEGRTLVFDKPTQATTAPSGSEAGTDPFVIEYGGNLISLRATLTGTGQVPELEVRGWNPKEKAAVSATGSTASPSAQLTTTPKSLATNVKGRKHLIGTALATSAAATAVATTAAATRAGGAAEIEGVVRGNAKLRAGTPVNLAKVGATFAGKYVLTAVRHDVDAATGYLTSFTAADASDRSLYGVVAGAPSPLVGAERHQHVTTGIVTNLKDPDQLGRVKVKFPGLSDVYESWWARPVQLGAGANRGTSWLPEVDDEVLVVFGQEAFDEPYVLGGLYNGKDKAGKGWAAHVNGGDGKVKRRALTSRTGMIVEFLEDAQAATLTVSTNDGAQHLTLTQSADKGIVLVSQGKLEVTAEQDITITGKQNISASTDTGTFSVKAMNVKLEAANGLELKGVTVKAEGSANTEVKGANVKVAASAAAELSAGAVTTVRGAMVKIN